MPSRAARPKRTTSDAAWNTRWSNGIEPRTTASRRSSWTGRSSDDHLWLARALGEKASRASFLSAFSLAKRVRAEFEEAVRLNPRNAEALADLGEFYYYTRRGWWAAASTRQREWPRNWTRSTRSALTNCGARLPKQRKDYGTAEREFKQAIAASPHPAFQWMALASFYRRRERWTEMEAAVRSGESAAERDKRAGVALYNGASLLTHIQPRSGAGGQDAGGVSCRQRERPKRRRRLWRTPGWPG